MAFLHLFLIVYLVHFSPLANCASSPEFQHTVRLNHHETIQTIEDFMAFDASQLQESLEVLPNSSSPYSIPVYHIDIFLKSAYKDYHSLILSRLAHDTKRVEWLAMASTSPVIDIPYYYENYSYVGIMNIGTPPQRAHLIVDTGSHFVWWACKPCKYCPSHSFDPSRSSSYRQVDCLRKDECPDGEGILQGCDRGGKHRCMFRVIYRDTSEAEGFLAHENVTTTWGEILVENLLYGCATKAPTFLINRKFIGLLGFGPNKYSFINQMNATSFGFCPKSHTATVATILYFNSLPIPDRYTIKVPIIPDIRPKYYNVELQGMFVSWEFLRIKSQINADGRRGATVDSGTSITRFPPLFYDEFRDAFRRHCEVLNRLPGESILDTCYNISSPNWFLDVPKVHFVFPLDTGYQLLSLDANQIMVPMGTDGKYCLAFAPTRPSDTIIGIWQLQGTRVSFDLVNQIVQFDPENCKIRP